MTNSIAVAEPASPKRGYVLLSCFDFVLVVVSPTRSNPFLKFPDEIKELRENK